MKYTIDELLDWIEEEKLTLDLNVAMTHNYIGFSHMETLVKKKNNELYMLRLNGEEKKLNSKEIENIDNFAESTVCEVYKLKDDIVIEIPFSDYKVEKYNDLSEKNRDIISRMTKYKFLEFAKVNTRGKVRKLLYDGYKLYKKAEGIENNFRLMSEELAYEYIFKEDEMDLKPVCCI